MIHFLRFFERKNCGCLQAMFANITDVIANEGDWPDVGFATGFRFRFRFATAISYLLIPDQTCSCFLKFIYINLIMQIFRTKNYITNMEI